MTDTFIEQYYNKCSSGEIIVGEEMMITLESHMQDLTDTTGIYLYDTKIPNKRIKFIEKHCRHSKSPFAGKPFILELWQKAYIESKLAFLMRIEDQWLRRFTQSLLLVARKNGKSPMKAAEALAEFFCGNEGTSIYCASNDHEQAAIVHNEINNMREYSPKLRRVSRRNNQGIFMGNIHRKRETGKYSYMNKAEIKKMSARSKNKEGFNIDYGIVDEVHEMIDSEMVEPLIQSMSTKDEYMLDEITTEGFTNDGYLDERLKEARQVLSGQLLRPRWHIWLYTQDSEDEIWQNRDSWVKSNPNLGVSKKWHFLDDQIERAKTNSATRAFTLAKDFNIKQSRGTAWLQENILINPAVFDIKDFAGSYYISGVDLAETTDLCAIMILLKRVGDPVNYLYSHYWIPESKLEGQQNYDGQKHDDGADYRQWQRDGHLTIVAGNNVDTGLVAKWQYDLYKNLDLKPYKCGYDNRFSKDYLNTMDEIFVDDSLTVNVPQSTEALNNPMNTMESDFRSKLINYNDNYADLYCFKNTGIVIDKRGWQMPAKLDKNKRIDGTSAALCAYAPYQWYRGEFHRLIGG